MVFALETEGLEETRYFHHLGVEPLAEEFGGELLAEAARG